MEAFSCTFCGKSRREVAKLVSGPRVFICNECVALCNDILAEGFAPGSTTMETARRIMGQAARSDSKVLIVGARGVGKTFAARTIHRMSERPGAFVTIRCGAPRAELELQRFGVQDAARGGTLFLEEVGSLPPAVQATLLDVLRQRSVDVRVLSANREPLTDVCARGDFRTDLARRLSTVVVEIPKLSDRIDELPGLVYEFMEDARRESGRATSPRLTPEALQRLCEYPWPGNVAQLRSVVRRALLVCNGAEISPADLTVEMPVFTRADEPQPIAAAVPAAEPREGDGEELAQDSSEPPEASEPSCSLCDQPESEARMLFRGSGAFICDACVAEAQATTLGTPQPGSDRTDFDCAFCGTPGSEVDHLVGVDDHHLICDACLDNYDQFLGERFSTSWPRGTTFALRTFYPAQVIDETASHAREELARGVPCRLVVLVHEDADPARRLLDRMRTSLADVADFWEAEPSVPGAALTAIALPVTRRP